MSVEYDKLRQRYAVVEVIGIQHDGGGTLVVRELCKDYRSAAERAHRMGGLTVPLTFPAHHPTPRVGEQYPFRAKFDTNLDQAVAEIRWQRERTQSFIVCYMEGKNGLPREGMIVNYDAGRDHAGRAQTRTATPTHDQQQDRRTQYSYFAVIQRNENLESRRGTVIGVYRRESPARVEAAERNRALQVQREAAHPQALSRAAFGEEARRYAEAVRQKLEQYRDRGLDR